MTAKRSCKADPAKQEPETVLASDLERMQLDLRTVRSELQAVTSAYVQQAQLIADLETELAATRKLSIALDSNASLDIRMRAAGMLSVSQFLADQPIDSFIRHVGVIDLNTFEQWLGMKRTEFLRLQARLELAERKDDGLYEWVMSHAATFSEVMINFKIAYRQESCPASDDHCAGPTTHSALH